MRKMAMGQYVPGNSFLHRADPRVKLATALLFVLGIFFLGNLATLLFMGAAVILASLLSRLPLAALFRSIRPLIYILVFTVVFHSLTFSEHQGDYLLKMGAYTMTTAGLKEGAFFALRVVVLIMLTSMVTLSTPLVALTDGLEYLLAPMRLFKVDPHEVAITVMIAMRFIPSLAEQAEQIIKAQMARGADFESGRLLKRAKAYIPIMIPLFVGAFRHAEQLALAMEARGYRGGKGRTKLRELKTGRNDLNLVAASATLLVALIFLDKTIS